MAHNTFQYSTSEGICKGDFAIYQAKSGAIMLMMGTVFTVLTTKQVSDLGISVYYLPDFSHDDYLKYYEVNSLEEINLYETRSITMSVENNTWRK